MSGHSSKPFHFQEIIASARGASSDSESSSSARSGHLDAAAALSSLKDSITAGYHGLDPILETITDIACLLTEASGAALAMLKDGAMLCRARSGESAPALGAQLNAETGISGECLRTGKLQHCIDAETDTRVDAEACRSRGLRSIVVLPIRSKRETNGILLAFSTQAAAFTDSHIAILQQLAALAEQARAAQVPGISSAVGKPLSPEYPLPVLPPKLAPSIDQPLSSAVMPELERLLDAPLASEEHRSGYRSRPIILGSAVLLVVALLALALWLGWRRPNEAARTHYAPLRSSGITATGAPIADSVPAGASGNRAPDNDPVWQPNPGGESLSPSVKSSTDNSVKLASQLDKVAAANTATRITVTDRVPRTQIQLQVGSNSRSRPKTQPEARPVETASAEPPPLASGSTPQSNVGDVLFPKVSLPEPPVQVSQGVSGGQLLSKTVPEYPVGARQMRLQGEVVLEAMVMEDGTVGAIRVVKGSPQLAQSAVDAVKNWRYQPYQLNGKPVRNETKIIVEFTLPSGASSH